MSGLDILGGIGAGIMKGQEMVQRHQTHTQKLREGELNMEAQRQAMEFQAREKARQEAEREREKQINAAYQNIYARTDLGDHEKHTEFARTALPLMTREQHQQILDSGDALYQTFGKDAIHRAGVGDLSLVQKLVNQKMPGATVSMQGKSLLFSAPDGRTQHVDMEGISQLLGMRDVIREQQAQEEHRLKMRQGQANIRQSNASASLGMANAEGQRIKNRMMEQQNFSGPVQATDP